MKIGLFNESFPPMIDGVANCVYNYAKCISKNHGDCVVVTPKYPDVTDDYNFEVYRFASFDISKSLGYRVGNVLNVKMLQDLKRKKFDLIHMHSPFAMGVIVEELKTMGVKAPVVFTYHTKYDIEMEKRLRNKQFRAVSMKFMMHNINLADEVWVVTEKAGEWLKQSGYTGKCRVMENGTDFPKGKVQNETTESLLAKYKKDDELLFLFVGRMMWYKNIALILDAMKLLKDKLKFKMIFVGDGADIKEIKHYAKGIGIENYVEFAGAIYDRAVVQAYFSIADMFVFPSTYDTSGLVVKEAAACELPSVLVKDSCAAEGIVDNENGYICDEEENSLAKRILEAVEDNRLNEVGKNAQNTVYLSWEDAVARASRRYEELIEEFKNKPKISRKVKVKIKRRNKKYKYESEWSKL